MKTVTKILPLFLFLFLYNHGKANDTPCDVPALDFTDTLYFYDINGHLIYGVEFTLNGNPYWCHYNLTTGLTTNNLPSWQYMEGFGDTTNAYLLYNFINQQGCEGVRMYFFFDTNVVMDDPTDDDDDDLSGNNGHGHGNGHGGNCGGGHGNTNGNNGHGNNDDGVDVSNPGQGSGGPNGQTDPSGNVDDENGNNGKNQSGISITVFPNPASDYIQVNSNTDNLNKIIIQNENGEILLTSDLSEPNKRIDLSSLNNGKHFYIVYTRSDLVKRGTLMVR